jgi:uncharacterized protein with GYD domain
MPAYCLLQNFTDQGIRTIREVGKRIDTGKELAQSLGIEVTSLHLCLGPFDVMVHLNAPNDEAVARFALALGARGNVRTTTLKMFTEPEYRKLVENLPS